MLASISLILALVCAGFILWDMYVVGHRQKMPVMEAVWPINALYFGPFALWAYYRWGREMTRGPEGGRENDPYWSKVAVGVMHCGAGCTLGDIIAEAVVFLTGLTLFASRYATNILFDFTLAFVLGIVFQYFAIAPMRGLGLRDGIWEALKADALSLIAFEVGLFGWMALMRFVLFHPPLEPNDPVYWFMMQIGMILGFVTSYPVNWWLIRRGTKEAM